MNYKQYNRKKKASGGNGPDYYQGIKVCYRRKLKIEVLGGEEERGESVIEHPGDVR